MYGGGLWRRGGDAGELGDSELCGAGVRAPPRLPGSSPAAVRLLTVGRRGSGRPHRCAARDSAPYNARRRAFRHGEQMRLGRRLGSG
jgi:hypothetical protein